MWVPGHLSRKHSLCGCQVTGPVSMACMGSRSLALTVSAATRMMKIEARFYVPIVLSVEHGTFRMTLLPDLNSRSKLGSKHSEGL